MLEAVPTFNHWMPSSLWWAACGSGFVKSGQLTIIISCLLFFTQWWITFKFSFHLFTFRTETFNDFLFTLTQILNPLVWLLKILHSGFLFSCHFLLNSLYFLMLIPSRQPSLFLPFSTTGSQGDLVASSGGAPTWFPPSNSPVILNVLSHCLPPRTDKG